MGYFLDPPANTESLVRLAAGDDHSASLESRVRSYLFANCVQCHQPGGAGRGSWDARITRTLEETALIGSLAGDNLGNPEARIVKPGSIDESVLYRRLAELGPHHMPPLATSVINEDAVDLMEAWILNDLPLSTAGLNTPPGVEFVKPEDGAMYAAPADIPLTIGAADGDGDVLSVEVFANDISLAVLTNQPFQFNWTNVPAGEYELTAVAWDGGADATNANPVVVTVADEVPLWIGMPSLSLHDLIKLAVFGPEGATAVLEISTNLPAFNPVATNRIEGGQWETVDRPASGAGNRFYRAITTPDQ
jgi:hypothetical protein